MGEYVSVTTLSGNDQLGDAVSGFRVGERVADLTVIGSNTAYRTLRADLLIRVLAGSSVGAVVIS
jgi:hypothetical protein